MKCALRLCVWTVPATAAAVATHAHAQPSAYPNKPLRVIVPFAAGGGRQSRWCGGPHERWETLIKSANIKMEKERDA